MKRGFAGGQTTRALLTVAVLCSFLFGSVAQAADCPARKVRILSISNENWRSNLIVDSSSGGKLPIGECVMSLARASVIAGGTIYVPDFDRLRCGEPLTAVAHVAELQLEDGVCAFYTTEATYRDAIGNVNIVTIPELGEPLQPQHSIRFGKAIISEERSTFIAFLPRTAGSTQIRVSVIDSSTGHPIADELLTVNGFTFYEMTTPVRIGSIEVANRGSQVGPETGADVDVLAFTAHRAGGGPRLLERIP
jgi:hypothetical protein